MMPHVHMSLRPKENSTPDYLKIMIQKRPDTIQVLLIDDSISIRNTLRNILNPYNRINVAAEAGDVSTAIKIVKKGFEGIAVIDINFYESYGIKLVKIIKKIRPEMPVIFLSFQSDIRYLQESFKGGASGFVIKERAYEDLPNAIISVADGANFISIDVVP